MTLGEKIKKLRLDKNLTQEDLAKILNTTKQTIYKYETGIVENLPLNRIAQLAHALGTTPAHLTGWEDHTPAFPADLHDVSSFTRIPIVASVKAGYDGLATEDFDGEYESLPTSELRHPAHEYRVLCVRGNSMYPQIISGDKVLVHLQPSVDSGDIAVVLYESDEATIKRVRYVSGEDWLDLVPANPEYETKHIEGAELEKCHVWGKVVKLMRDF